MCRFVSSRLLSLLLPVLAAGCIQHPDVELGPGSIPSGTVGQPYLATFVGSGGDGDRDYRLSGRLPEGLSFWTADDKAFISGTPLVDGDFPITISVSDGAHSASRSYLLHVAAFAGPALSIDTVTIPGGTVGVGYSQPVAASGGTGAGYAWVIDSGALPPGLALTAGTPTATVDGTPTLPGSYSFVLRVTDSGLNTTTRGYSVTIAGDILISPPFPLPQPAVGSPYTLTLTASGGTGTYNWSVIAGVLPPGLALAPTGTPSTSISGTPTVAGRYMFTVQVLGSGTGAGSLNFDLTVVGGLQITTTTLPSGAVGGSYFANVNSTGGAGGPYTWSVVLGSLPPGISLTGTIASGSLSGAPTTAGTFAFTVQVQDSASGIAQAALSIQINSAGLSILTGSVPNAPPGLPYATPVTASGGTGSGYQWSIIGGSLPTGVSLSPTGTPSASLSGTPTQSGTFNFTVRVQDSGSSSNVQALSLRIYSPGEIWTVAGTGTSGFNGDGIAAAQAMLNIPAAVAPGPGGLVYIADTQNHRVRVINTATGLIATFAGTGFATYSADGIPASSSALNEPRDLAVDGAGNLYIADTGNHRVRRVDAASGLISTVAGNGTAAYSGDGGPATAASLSFPQGVAVDALGNVYIADADNFVIRRVNAANGIITTFAGNNSNTHSGDGGQATSAGIGYPSSVALDSLGNVYIGETYYYVRRVAVGTGVITTVAGVSGGGTGGDGGPATSAGMVFVSSLFIDSADNVFIGDGGRVRRIDASTWVMTTVAGATSGGSTADGIAAVFAALSFTIDVAVDAQGRVWLTTSGASRLRAVVP